MADHKTITLDEISNGIYKDWKKNVDFNFSAWIRAKMLEDYNKGQTNLAAFERKVPPHYHCQLCLTKGSHWTKDCPRGEEE